MALSLSTLIRQSPNTIATQIEGDFVIMNTTTCKAFGLDRRASRVWEMLDQFVSIDQVVKSLLQRYDTSEEQCQRDVVKFLEEMILNQLAEADVS